MLAAADAKVDAIDEDYEMGLMSPEERHKQVVDIWNDATEEVGEAMAANFDQYNPIYMMADSGARGNIKQIRQLAGMRGLMADTEGRAPSTARLSRTSARAFRFWSTSSPRTALVRVWPTRRSAYG